VKTRRHCIESVSTPWITPAGEAQADSEGGAASMGGEHFREACNTAPGRQTGGITPLLILLAAVCGLMPITTLAAADFVFFWKADTNPSVAAYGVYQRSADSAYEKIDEVSVQDLDNSATPYYQVSGLAEGTTYWFAATSISANGTESALSNQTCITVNGQIVECTDDDNNSGTTVFISCFITAAGF
jgi:hypothetical protein